jgi:hypothetical protein
MSHRKLRVNLRGALKRPDALFVIEAVDERQPLIEEPLGLRLACGDRMMNVSQARDQRDWLRITARRVLVLRWSVYRKQQQCECKQTAFHKDLIFLVL